VAGRGVDHADVSERFAVGAWAVVGALGVPGDPLIGTFCGTDRLTINGPLTLGDSSGVVVAAGASSSVAVIVCTLLAEVRSACQARSTVPWTVPFGLGRGRA
jgi:hypothetical protein